MKWATNSQNKELFKYSKNDPKALKPSGHFLVAGTALAGGLLNKRFAVNTLTNRGICFVGCNTHLVKGAVIFIAAMIFTLLYRTFDGGIWRLVFHVFNLPDPNNMEVGCISDFDIILYSFVYT